MKVLEKKDLKKFMSFKKDGKVIFPISAIRINNTYILAIYEGNKSDADIVIRYRQKLKNNRWSNIRTPKHIHWTVDILLKMSQDKETTKKFLDDLLSIWYKEIKPLKKEERDNIDLNEFLKYDVRTLEKYKRLSKYGEYNIKFLLLLAKLLMFQEKTNYPQGKMFQTLIKKLKDGEDLFSILQTATFR